MTDYTSIADSQTAPLSPVTSELMTALRDNPLAIAEGAVGAPNLRFAALGTLVAGDSLRVQGPNVLTTGTSTFGTSVSHGFSQQGTVRCVVNYVSGTVDTRRVVRVRNGVSTTLASSGGTSPLTVDVSVIHGDQVLLQGTGNADTGTGTHSGQIKIASGNLWVGVGGIVEGNDNV